MGTESLLLILILVILITLIIFGWRIKKRALSESEENLEIISEEISEDIARKVDWTDELQQIIDEKKDESWEQEEQAKRRQLEEQKFVAELDGMVTELLSKMGDVQWGPERYALVSGTEWGNHAWEVRSLVRKDASDDIHQDYYEVFSVRLRRSLGQFYFSGHGASKEEHSTAKGDVSEDGLKDVLKNVMRTGPRTKTPYEILASRTSDSEAG
jgi:hypothetical protein